MDVRSLALIALAGSVIAIGAPPAGLAQPQPFDGAYKGGLECEQMPEGIGTLRTPLAMIVRNGTGVASAPMFDIDGRQELAATVVKIGNSSGRDIDKFSEFGLTPKPGAQVRAPLIDECFANFECKLVDSSLIRSYSLFVFEVVKAHVATVPKYPKTIHYRGDGEFMISGANTRRYRRLFKPRMLDN